VIRPRPTLLIASLLGVIAAVAGAAPAAIPPAEWFLEQVKTLASPAMEGRRSGTAGADLAARHVARVFGEAGLKPGGDQSGYLQAFSVPTGIRLGSPNTMAVVGPASRAMTLEQDFVPLAVSENGRVDGDLVFAGYGITAGDLGWDDYAAIDVHDRIVLVLAGEPRGRDAGSPFRKPDAYHYSERRHKVINARQHGARAVLLVTSTSANKDRLPELRGLTQPWGVLAAAVTRPVADALLAPTGTTLTALAERIDRAFKPDSFPVPGVKLALSVDLVRERGTTANVIGVLPGTDGKLKDEAIVVGAHYDHLGRGGEGSLAPDAAGTIHPGADDNASGVAAVMGLARTFAAGGGVPRTLVFVAFAGEEMGLLGSEEYVRHPAFPLDRTALMVNLDMVGRLRDGKLYVGGVDTAKDLRALVENAARGVIGMTRGLPLAPELRGDPYSPSDHTPFYGAGRPVLFLFTGAHADYHRPTDTWDKINSGGLRTVTELAFRVVTAVAAVPAPLEYVKVTAPASGGRAAGGGYGPFFGVVPEFGATSEAGVKVSSVRAGSPAEKAGLQAGDVLVEFGGVTIKTLEDMTFALRSRRAGDEVDVVVMRGGQEHRVRATLEERR
jgi:peptidase M28-like protein/PDZ domain-containing protein/PA domain-containing protein